MQNIFYNAERKANQLFNSFKPLGVIEYNDLLRGFFFPSCATSTPVTYPAFFNLSSSESLNVPEILNILPFELKAIFSDI